MTDLQFTQFLNLVDEMRKTQREYFATRSYASLKKSKQLEKRVDECIASIKRENIQPKAFQLDFDFDTPQARR